MCDELEMRVMEDALKEQSQDELEVSPLYIYAKQIPNKIFDIQIYRGATPTPTRAAAGQARRRLAVCIYPAYDCV